MIDGKKSAEQRRAEARRARRLAGSLSQLADRERLHRYADELEGKAPKPKAPDPAPPSEKPKR